MSQRTVLAVLVMLALLIPPLSAAAQGPPEAINDALADLSTRAGRTLTLNDLSNWSWNQTNYTDTSLGCPQPDTRYTQVLTPAYRFLLVYNGVTYDYRVSADRQIVVLCSAPPAQSAATPASPTAARTPAAAQQVIPTPTSAGRDVCPGALPTRLDVGVPARAANDGTPENLRSAPNTTSAILGQVPAGTQVEILEGPECAESSVWWQVNYNTLNGWIAEGSQGSYGLEPLSAPVPTPGASPATPAPTQAIPQVYDLPLNRQTIGVENAPAVARLGELTLSDAVIALAWSPDGSTLAATVERGVWVYPTESFTTPPRLLQVPGGPAYAVAFSPDGALMATAHADGTVRLWDISTGGQRAVLRGHTEAVRAVTFSPDGQTIASGGGNETTGADSTIRLWEAASGSQIAVLEGHAAAVTALAFSPDGTLLASASADQSVRLWDVVSATPATTLSGHSAPVRAVAFGARGTLASAGDDGTIRLWDIASGDSETLDEHAGAINALAFSPDGALLASAGGEDGSLRLWDVAGREEAAALTDFGATSPVAVQGVSFSPDGAVLAFATVQNTQSILRLWGVLP